MPSESEPRLSHRDFTMVARRHVCAVLPPGRRFLCVNRAESPFNPKQQSLPNTHAAKPEITRSYETGPHRRNRIAGVREGAIC